MRQVKLVDGEEPQDLLKEMFESAGWRLVARPALRNHLRVIEEKIARGLRMPDEEIRRLQHRYSLLLDVLERPDEFFLPPD